MPAQIISMSKTGARGNRRAVRHSLRENGQMLCRPMLPRPAPDGFTGAVHECRSCLLLCAHRGE